jgi:phosphate transport system protein
MGELVLERLEASLQCLRAGDPAAANAIVTGDADVNEQYLSLESRCVELFALQQPVAGDLRLITASFKIITDLERVGDLAVNLAENSLATQAELGDEVAIDAIGRDAVDLLEHALDAYNTGDSKACHDIVAADDEIDARCQRASEHLTRELIAREAGSDEPWGVEQLLDEVTSLLLSVRDLERIADHAVNIAARTLYMVESDPELIR